MLPRVMIVEDEEVIREIYALKFELEGYMVEVADNGQRALEKIDSFRPHYILLDMMMPIMDGVEFMKRFAKNGPPAAEVIVFSNISATKQRDAVMQLGAAAYWIKSDFTPEQIVAAIAERWQRRGKRNTAAGA